MAARGGYKGGRKKAPSRTRQAPRKAVFMLYMIKYPHTEEKSVYGANNALVRRRVLGPFAWPVPEMPSRTRQAPRKVVLFTYYNKIPMQISKMPIRGKYGLSA